MSGYGPPRGWRGSNAWAAEASQRSTEGAEVGDHMERLRAKLTPTTKALILGDGDVRDLRAALDEVERLRAQGTEYGIRADFTDTTSAEFTVAETLDEALEALAEFDTKHGGRVVSRELVQRPVGDWQKVDEHA